MDRASVRPALGAVVRDVMAPFLVTRAALLVVATAAAASIPPIVACGPCDLSTVSPLSALARWDAGAYLEIARDGYSHVPDAHSNVTFSPLLPLLARALAAVAGRADDDALLAAAVVVSNVALIVGLVSLTRLGQLEVGADAARRTALYVLVFPTTIFLSAVYPESLFLALAISALVEAKRSRWPLAGGLAALAALARPFGALLAVPLAVEAAAQRRRQGSIGPLSLATALGAPVAAFVAWQAFLYTSTGDPFAFFNAQAAFGRRPTAPWAAVAALTDSSVYGFPWIVLSIFALSVALVAASWRKLSAATAAYATTMLVATASSGTLTSFPRYALALAPAWLVLGALASSRPVHLAYLALSTALAVVLTAMFASWAWVG